MRRAVIRLMLLVVFLNTNLGAWLHETLHLAGMGERLHLLADGVAGSASDPATNEDRDLHPACVWCLTQAHQAPGGAPPAVFAAPLSGSTALDLSRSTSFPPDADRWPFAARDPPRILG